MNEQTPKLVEPTTDLKFEFLAMAEEYRAAGEDRYRSALEDFSAYLRRLEDDKLGVGLPVGRVPSTTYWLVSDGKVIGRSTLRHWLTPALEREGGHIGYDIRPLERRKGFGTLILRLVLVKARQHGLARVLVTCDFDNTGSARIIEKNGGKLHGQSVSDKSGKRVSQYWIEL